MIARCIWMPEVRALLVELSGRIDAAEVERWAAGLDAELAKIPPGTEIVLLSNFHGFEPTDDEANDRIQAVLPARLAALAARDVMCSKIAHVHHDAELVAAYESTHASPRERFFTSAAFANEWLLFD